MFRLCLIILVLGLQEPPAPLPDTKDFLAEFRKTLHRDETLLSQYTYTEKETKFTLDSKGKTKNTETNVNQIIRGVEEWQTYRRIILKNGIPLTAEELQK